MANVSCYVSICLYDFSPDKTTEGYNTEFVKKGLIHRESQDQYINSFLENESNSGESNNQGSSGFQGN